MWQTRAAQIALAIWSMHAFSAHLFAQTVLPGIVVTTPSPVAKPPSLPREPAESSESNPSSPRSAAKPQRPVTGTAAPPPATPQSGGESPLQPPVGTLLIADDAFAPVTIVTPREIESKAGSSLTDALQTKPGILGSNFAPGANRPIIRGLDNYRVRVQENGIGSHDVSNLSEDHAVPIDPFAADQVEVVRGPATLRYGSQAIGGVVSASSNRIPEFAPPRGFSSVIKGGLNSGDNGRDSAFKVTAGAGSIVVHSDAFASHADDYRTPHGRQANSFVDRDGFAVGGSYVWKDGFAGVSFARFNSLYGIPGAEAAAQLKRIDLAQDRFTSRGEWRVRSGGIEAIRYWLGASDYGHNELTGEGEIGSRFENKEWEARVEIQHLPLGTMLGELHGAAGVQLGRRTTSGLSFEGDNLIETARTRSAAAFWFEELQVTRQLRLQLATRIDQTSVEGIGITEFADPMNSVLLQGRRNFTPLSGSTGALYDLPLGVVARVTGQYVERAPDAGEQFSKGAHEATGTFEIGNPNLEKEKARTIELGLKRAKGDLRFDATVFRTRFDGFIYKQLTGVECGARLETCGEETGLKQLVFQSRNAVFQGGEVSAQYDIAPLWRGVWGIEGQYDLVYAHFAGDGNVPRIPPHRLGGGVFYRDAHWFARAGVLHALRQDRIGEGETPTSGYTLVNAELAYSMKPDPSATLAPEITIGLKGENLLDDDVRNHVSFKKDEVLQPGRTVRLFGSIKFN